MPDANDNLRLGFQKSDKNTTIKIKRDDVVSPINLCGRLDNNASLEYLPVPGRHVYDVSGFNRITFSE